MSGKPATTPFAVNAASRAPVITSIAMPVSSRATRTKASPFFASLSALVPTALTGLAPSPVIAPEKSFNAARDFPMFSSLRFPVSLTPSASLVTDRAVYTREISRPRTEPMSSLRVFEPTSTEADSMVVINCTTHAGRCGDDRALPRMLELNMPVPAVFPQDSLIAEEGKDMERVILRFLDKRLMKGYLEKFSPSDETVSIKGEDSVTTVVGIGELKGIFFVRSFAGDRKHREKKSFKGNAFNSKKVFVRFRDGESMVGFVDGEVPWEKGFFLHAERNNGFFVKPVDGTSNNIKIFVVAASIDDVTVVE
jgi:hypothetical protein